MYFSINHKILSSEIGRRIIKLLPVESILTETDAPFTFDQAIKNRLSSLDKSVCGIASILKYEIDEVRESIYQNFKEMLISCN
jgi:TatD DNase family protein